MVRAELVCVQYLYFCCCCCCCCYCWLLLLLLLLLLLFIYAHLPLLSISHINATVYPRGYFTRRGKYLPLGVNLMHINGAFKWPNTPFICISLPLGANLPIEVKFIMWTHLPLGVKFAHVGKIPLLLGRGKYLPLGVNLVNIVCNGSKYIHIMFILPNYFSFFCLISTITLVFIYTCNLVKFNFDCYKYCHKWILWRTIFVKRNRAD